MFRLNPAPKPKHRRIKPKRGDLTRITDKVRKEVERRSKGRCERCGCTRAKHWFEHAHLINASQLGSGGEPWNIAKLCGPRTATGTCHQFADDTATGREWCMDYRFELIAYYTDGAGSEIWPYDGPSERK
ncbi:hypothetical protein [Paenibacillus sp. FJAT-26967]|uniref:hypothetical protein n=1 Tax=Paenibacillus sp. FJAT-26967 TaxID=1729690 RepID=UPI00083902A0|nr:hypothetical protein [Paenibacillus sp. FJAT-26967]